MMRLMKWVMSIIGLLVVLLVALAIYLSTQFNVNDFKAEISNAVHEKTSFLVNFGGEIHLSFFPGLGIRAKNIEVTNPRAKANADLAKIGDVDVQVKLIPLLHKQIRIDKVLLDHARFNLVEDKASFKNWQEQPIELAQSQVSTTGTKTKAAPLALSHSSSADKAKSQAALSKALQDFNLSKLTIKDTDIHWQSARENKQVTVSHLDFASKNIALGKTFPWQVAFKLDNQTPQVSGQISASGQLQVSQNLQRLQFNKLKFKTDLTGKTLPDKKLALTLSSDLLALSDKNLMIKNLNLDNKALGLTGLNSEADFVIPGSGDVKHMQLQGHVTAKQMTAQNFVANDVKANLQAKQGVWQLNGLHAKVYQGQLQAQAQADFSRTTPKYQLRENLTGLQAGQLLKVGANQMGNVFEDFKNYPILNKLAKQDTPITGNADLQAQLVTSGKTDEQLKRNLTGHVNFAFRDGVIKGVDLAYWFDLGDALLKHKQKPQRAKNEETPFGNITATFNLGEGIASTDNFLLISPYLKISAKGNANLLTEKLDFNINVSQMRNNQEGGLQVPLLLSGNFSKPNLGPDMKTIAKSQAKKQISNQIDKYLGKSPVGNALKKQLQGLF